MVYAPIAREPEQYCNQKRNGFTCTRTAGHNGMHTAHGMSGEPLKYWKDTKDAKIERLTKRIAELEAELASKRKGDV